MGIFCSTALWSSHYIYNNKTYDTARPLLNPSRAAIVMTPPSPGPETSIVTTARTICLNPPQATFMTPPSPDRFQFTTIAT